MQLRAGRLVRVRVNVPGQGFRSRPLCHRSLWELQYNFSTAGKHMF